MPDGERFGLEEMQPPDNHPIHEFQRGLHVEKEGMVREKIIEIYRDTLEEFGVAEFPDFDGDFVLLESGLDSVGFAVLVTKLDMELDFDPFTESDVPIYPVKFSEFVAMYDRV